MGHEAAGVVERVGPGVASFAAGDRVTVDSTIYNPESFFSRRGLPNLCDERRVLGVSCADYRRDGAFAELVAVPSHIAYHLPPGISFEQAAMVEPLAIAAHARRLPVLEAGDRPPAVGTGPIRLMPVQGLPPTPAVRHAPP